MSSQKDKSGKVIYMSGFRPQQPSAPEKEHGSLNDEASQKEFREKVTYLAAEIRSFEAMLTKLKNKKKP